MEYLRQCFDLLHANQLDGKRAREAPPRQLKLDERLATAPIAAASRLPSPSSWMGADSSGSFPPADSASQPELLPPLCISYPPPSSKVMNNMLQIILNVRTISKILLKPPQPAASRQASLSASQAQRPDPSQARLCACLRIKALPSVRCF